MIYNYYSHDEKELNKASIYGALDLYLDFINVFLNLLRLFGRAKD
jgi:FtsH-binding integral membrane protein